MANHFLGIDLGTTSLSLTVLDGRGRVITCETLPHGCGMALPHYPDAFAMDGEKLTALAKARLLASLEADPEIVSVGVTGQMHGISCVDGSGKPLTPLYTWQCALAKDRVGRGKETYLDLLEALVGERIPAGYGLSTLFTLDKLGIIPDGTVTVATAGELLLSALLGKLVPMHPTNAASLGGYDLKKGRFAEKLWKKAGLSHRMPTLVKDDVTVGELVLGNRRLTLSAAIGDNQASVYGSLSREGQVLINVGTGSQISEIVEKIIPDVDMRPYFGGKYLRVNAALSGGSAYALLCDLVKGLLADFGCEASEGEIYAYLNRAAEKNSKLTVKPTFAGTFDDPDRTGSIEGITLANFTIPSLANGFLKGMIRELYDGYLATGGEDGVIPVVSGNAMRQNPTLRALTHRVFGMETLMPAHKEEAAFGAALYGGVSSGFLTEKERAAAIGYLCE